MRLNLGSNNIRLEIEQCAQQLDESFDGDGDRDGDDDEDFDTDVDRDRDCDKSNYFLNAQNTYINLSNSYH